MNLLRAFLKDSIGATAVEYGLITALIAVAMIAGIGAIGNNLQNMFGMLSDKVDVAGP
jgi:pilus assembly protein Flp/PilA